jgi:hypothetical protein
VNLQQRGIYQLSQSVPTIAVMALKEKHYEDQCKSGIHGPKVFALAGEVTSGSICDVAGYPFMPGNPDKAQRAEAGAE